MVLLGLIVKIVLMMALGFVLRKTGLMDEEFQKKLSAILIKVVMPAKMIAAGNIDYAPELGQSLLITGGVVLCYYVGANLLLNPLSRVLPVGKENKGQFVNLAVYSNNSFIGFPIVNEMYGAVGVLYGVIHNLIQNLFLYSLGVKTLCGGKVALKKVLLNHVTLIALGAVIWFVLPWRMPAALVDTCNLVGDMAAPFSMFIVGGSLAGMRMRSLMTDGWAWLINGLRMGVFPLAAAGILWAAGLRGVMPAASVVLLGMPTATANVALAEEYDQDVPFAARTAVQGTALMVLTLPLLQWLTGKLFF